MQVGERFEELTYSYMPAYSDLASANVRSLERALEYAGSSSKRSGRRTTPVSKTRYEDRFDALGGQDPTGNPGRARFDPGTDPKGPGAR